MHCFWAFLGFWDGFTREHGVMSYEKEKSLSTAVITPTGVGRKLATLFCMIGPDVSEARGQLCIKR
jgi:hypothetical protein